MPQDGTNGIDGLATGNFRAAQNHVMPKAGELFAGRYSIEKMVGRGGMGEVYLATQSPLNRRVALKILKAPESIEDDPNFDARFLREAAAAARLQHPNTITVYDFGQDEEGRLYIVMEYLEGNDLRTVLAHQGIFSAQRAIHVAKQVCKSLREAHAKGIIHRDLKPANVLLIDRDEDVDFVKVLDFGLVKLRDDDSEITLAGKFLGSPKYTSPEALDRHAIVDHRADIYATGILLYAMLTGAPPFDGDPIQVLNAHLHETPRPMYRMNPAAQTTPELEALVARCMEKKPEKRFNTMGELLHALREVGAYFGDEHTETLDLDLSEPGERAPTGGYPMIGAADATPSARPHPASRRVPTSDQLRAAPSPPSPSLAPPPVDAVASPRSRSPLLLVLLVVALVVVAALLALLTRQSADVSDPPVDVPLDPVSSPEDPAALTAPPVVPSQAEAPPVEAAPMEPTPATTPRTVKPSEDPSSSVKPTEARPTPVSKPPVEAKPARTPKPKPSPTAGTPTPTAGTPTPAAVPAGYKENPY